VASGTTLLPSRRTVRRWDAAAVVFVLLCAAAGVVAGMQIWALAELHRGLVQTAEAFDLTARALGTVGNVPVIGDDAGRLAGSVQDAATQIRVGALEARAEVRTLAVAVGAAIAVLPVVPVLAVYVPLRVAWHRGVRLLGVRPPAGGPEER
jgi:hypothetical protein